MLTLFVSGITSPVQAQQHKNPASFHGAEAVKKEYKAVFELNSNDDKVISGTLRNMANVLKDPRLKDKVKLELVAHSGGIAVYMKDGKYGPQLKKLTEQGVILAACENTMNRKGISKSALFPFVSTVPSGVGELIIRQQQGWAILHP